MNPELQFHRLDSPVLVARPEVPWADTSVLNPAIVADPETERLHMLFRATGPWPEVQMPGRPLPYPIFLGYAWSDDGGRTWTPDFSRPALAPALKMDADDIVTTLADGHGTVNHANGCIEDPRLVWLEGRLFLTVACRMFPPGPFWERDEPTQCSPDWVRGAHRLGRAARENVSVSVLFAVDLCRLGAGDYEGAFSYVTHLTDPEHGDNRDVMLFPERLRIGGKLRYVCLHRPFEPGKFVQSANGSPPSILVAAADRLEDFASDRVEHRLLARPEFAWEGNRVGASWGPLKLGNDEWLLPYHGKQDSVVGYTQSFMILRTSVDGWPDVAHRCPDRLMYARKTWELTGKLKTPCVFTCGGIVVGPDLVMSYGAADTVAGVAWVNFEKLLVHIRRYDAHGRGHADGSG